MLEGVGDADRERLGVHGEQGEERFDLALAKVAGHDLAHLNQLARTVAAVGAAPPAARVAVLGQLLAFLGVAAVVIVVPGPDTALTVRNALAGGRRCGVATAAGVATGQAVWTLATGVGVAELLHASEPAFLVMKTAGAAYLVALGLQSLWSAAGAPPLWSAAGVPPRWSAPGGPGGPSGEVGRGLRQGW